MRRFKPPIDDPFALTLIRIGLPLALKFEKLVVAPSRECMEKIWRLRGKHTVIFANHSDRHDPLTVFSLAEQAGEKFNYMAARELFDFNFGFRGWVMQRAGCYSVVRGGDDSESIEMTRSLIISGERKLVMFPEGDVSGSDERIQKVKRGAVRIVLDAQTELVDKGRADPVFILPIVILYELQADAENGLSRALLKMEQELKLHAPGSNLPIEERMERVSAALLQHLETYYNVASWDSMPIDRRLRKVARQIITRHAQCLGTTLDTAEDESAMLHDLRSKLSLQEEEKLSDCAYCRTLKSKSRRRREVIVSDLNRVQRLLIIAGTMRQEFSLDVAWRVIDRLEKEILGQISRKASRVARVSASEPVSLLPYVEQFRADPDTTTNHVAHKIRAAMNNALNRMKQPTRGERISA